MYAVIETGGKQYRVQPGDVIDIERLDGVEEPGATVEFDRVLMVSGDDGVQIGKPLFDGATVQDSLVDEVRGPKILVFKIKRRKRYRRAIGHRQNHLRVKIEEIQA